MGDGRGDLLRASLEPLRGFLRAALAGSGWSAPYIEALIGLFDLLCLAGLAYALAPLSDVLRACVASAPRATWARVKLGVASVGAVALCAWDFVHPASNVLYLIVRWDHVAFAALAGPLLACMAAPLRASLLALLSIAVTARYVGIEATAVVCVCGAVAYATAGKGSAGRNAAVLAALAVAAYALSWWLRGRNFLVALETYGLFSVVFLRLVSVAVSAQRDGRPPLGDYACYATFYLGSFGFLFAPEVYADFRRRNLAGRLHFDAAAAARGVAYGALQIWLALRIPVSPADLFTASGTLAAWQVSLLLFVRTALHSMGFWAILDGCAVFLGYRLHPNFRGLLSRRNPSELWWAWRGTFTNWLVRHVYAPLGADRRHQSLNILAAFGVSWFWHIMGVPFLLRSFRPLDLVPLSAWALLNAAAVVAHVQAQKRGWRLLPASTPVPLRRGVHIALTLCLASTAVTFLSFQGKMQLFAPFLKVLAGLR